jgi:hypothetical protein
MGYGKMWLSSDPASPRGICIRSPAIPAVISGAKALAL